MDRCELSNWTVDLQREPMIRVGIVLPADGMKRLRIDVPATAHRLMAGAVAAGELAGTAAEVMAEGGRVRITWAGLTVGPVDVLKLVPPTPPTGAPAAGVVVHDVLTGRGFHWQKRISPAHEGVLEFRAYDDFLLVVNEVGLEEYLPGVITAEMSGECPLEFLKSQCLVARSWVLAHSENKHPEWPIDRCNDDCCQRYQGSMGLTPRAVEAVRATRGEVVLDRTGAIIDTNYSKSCGGIIEAPENVWFVHKPGQRSALDAPPDSPAQRFFPVTHDNLDEFLTGSWLASADVYCSPNVVPDAELPRYLGSVDEGGGHFRWTVRYTREELERILRQKVFDRPGAPAPPRSSHLYNLRVMDRGDSGRATELEVEYRDADGGRHRLSIAREYQIRDALHERFLYSSAFRVGIERDERGLPVHITLTGAGWGHGAGMCQIGALGMALKGYTCSDIVRHYFEDVEICTCY